VSAHFDAPITVDSTAPTITNISSTKANGSYKVGEVIDINLTFSEPVTSTGNVTVTLETGLTDRTCTFTVTNSSAGSCSYTVQAGDTSSDLTVSSVSGTIKDAVFNTLTNFTPTTNLAANKDIVIDTASPIVSLVSSVPASTTSTITWTTDESSSSQVDYGLTTGYGTSTTESDTGTRVSNHTVILSNLDTCTTYHYRVNSKDTALNLTQSGDYSFKTLGCQESSSSSSSSTTSTSSSSASSSSSRSRTSSSKSSASESSISSIEAGRTVVIKVEDKDGNPLEGARVELHSDVQVAYTDKNGLATFTNVVGDNHDLVVTYKNTTFTKKLSLLEVSKDSNNNYNSTFAFVDDKTVVEKPTTRR
jgi:hypothetical protein